jgi:hypothetical protein
MVALHANDPKLHRVLVEQVPRLKGGQPLVQRLSEQAATLVRGRPSLRASSRCSAPTAE